jgi:hypothetical protein
MACLSGPARAAAKPPDLPIILEDEYLSPQPEAQGGGLIGEPDGPCAGTDASCPPAGTKAAQSKSTRSPKLSVRARRNLATCLLFTIHPLLGLTPTDGLVDMPADHPFSGKMQDLQVQVQECQNGCFTYWVPWDGLLGRGSSDPERQNGCLIFGVGISSDSGLTGSIVLCDRNCPIARCIQGVFSLDTLLTPKTWVECLKKMASRERTCPMAEWVKSVERMLTEAKVKQTCCWEENGTDIVSNPRLTCQRTDEYCPKDEEYCPWMKQQARECQRASVVDPQVTRDVLANLQNLIDAQDLLKVAENLRHRGQVVEALDCYEIISKLCPGSRFDESANRARTELFNGLYTSTSNDKARAALTSRVEHGRFVECTRTNSDCSEFLCSEEHSSKPFVTESVERIGSWKSRIKGRLQSPVSLHYSQAPLSRVVEDIGSCNGVNIVFDVPALEDAGINPEMPITINFSNVTLQSALKLILHQARLKYTLKYEVVLVVPEAHASAPNCTSGVRAPASKAQPGVCEHVRGLMKACRLAVETGRHQKAIELAREAFALDPEAASADPLVYKMHLVSCQTPQGACLGRSIGSSIGCVVGGSRCGALIGAAVGATAGACASSAGKCGECKCPVKGLVCSRSKEFRSMVQALVGICKSMMACPCQKKEAYPACYTNAEEECEVPCDPKEGNQGPEANSKPVLQPGLPALDAGLVRYLERLEDDAEDQETKDLEVVVEEKSTSRPIEMKLGYLLPSPLSLLNTTCADIKVTPGQVEVSWQVKLGPCVWQVRYGKAGCSIDPMTIDIDE